MVPMPPPVSIDMNPMPIRVSVDMDAVSIDTGSMSKGMLLDVSFHGRLT